MNWARAKSRPRARANERAARVLPSPGKSSSSTWPLARIAHEHQPQRLPLADDGLADLVEHPAGDGGGLLDGGCFGVVVTVPRSSSRSGRSRSVPSRWGPSRTRPARAQQLLGARVVAREAVPGAQRWSASSRSRSRRAASGSRAVRWLSRMRRYDAVRGSSRASPPSARRGRSRRGLDRRRVDEQRRGADHERDHERQPELVGLRRSAGRRPRWQPNAMSPPATRHHQRRRPLIGRP